MLAEVLLLLPALLSITIIGFAISWSNTAINPFVSSGQEQFLQFSFLTTSVLYLLGGLFFESLSLLAFLHVALGTLRQRGSVERKMSNRLK